MQSVIVIHLHFCPKNSGGAQVLIIRVNIFIFWFQTREKKTCSINIYYGLSQGRQNYKRRNIKVCKWVTASMHVIAILLPHLVFNDRQYSGYGFDDEIASIGSRPLWILCLVVFRLTQVVIRSFSQKRFMIVLFVHHSVELRRFNRTT